MQRKIDKILILLLFLLIGCENKDNIVTEKNDLDSLDYVVIAVAMENTIYSKYDTLNYDTVNIGRYFRLIIDSTVIENPKPWLVDKHRVNFPAEDYLVNELLNANNKVFHIDSTKLKTKFTKVVISRDDIRNYIKSMNTDTITYNSYRLSAPYIDKKNGLAFILKEYSSSDNKSYEYIWLKKSDNKWKVYDRWYDSY